MLRDRNRHPPKHGRISTTGRLSEPNRRVSRIELSRWLLLVANRLELISSANGSKDGAAVGAGGKCKLPASTIGNSHSLLREQFFQRIFGKPYQACR